MDDQWVRLVVGVLVLLAVAIGAARIANLSLTRDLVVAIGRAAVQLTVVALALRGVFAAPIAAVAVLALMFGVATWTASRRLRQLPGAASAVIGSCAAGAVTSIAVLVALPTLDRDLRTLIAVSGIVFGGTMTSATLAGRNLIRGLHSRRDEVEAWLAIGATTRHSVRDIARTAAREALVPALDQTRTTGLVTLPGAFIGALLGGASAAGAARFQIAALAGLLCAETVTAVTLTYRLGAPAVLPAELADG